jgi:hypothetical protein
MTDVIYYLIHITNNKDQIIKDGKLKVSNAASDGFPGVFFTLITSRNLGKEMLYPGKDILIFSKTLLMQNNYHYNHVDKNGIIVENTLFPWNINKLFSYYTGKYDEPFKNEIVFHDDIDIKYLCKTLKRRPYVDRFRYFPKHELTNKTKPDYTKLPFLVYCDYSVYSGVKESFDNNVFSLNFIKLMANVARVSDKGTKEEILKRINVKRKYLHTHRHEQNMFLFCSLNS